MGWQIRPHFLSPCLLSPLFCYRPVVWAIFHTQPMPASQRRKTVTTR